MRLNRDERTRMEVRVTHMNTILYLCAITTPQVQIAFGGALGNTAWREDIDTRSSYAECKFSMRCLRSRCTQEMGQCE